VLGAYYSGGSSGVLVRRPCWGSGGLGVARSWLPVGGGGAGTGVGGCSPVHAVGGGGWVAVPTPRHGEATTVGACHLVAPSVRWSSVAHAVVGVVEVPGFAWCYPPGGHEAGAGCAVGVACFDLWS